MGLMVLFTKGFQSHLPLGTKEKFANPNFPIPVSIVMGDRDWMRKCDDDYGKICVEARLENHNPDLKFEEKGHFYICPTSGHNLHMDNPIATTNIIINDIFGEDEEVLQTE